MRSSENIFKKIDWVLVICYLLLVFFGLLNITASCYSDDGVYDIFDFSTKYGKQLIWIGISILMAFIIIFAINPDVYLTLSWGFYILMIGVLLIMPAVGTEVNGSKSWLALGPIRFQPAELAKIATYLVLATFMSKPSFTLKSTRNAVTVALLIILPAGLILLEHETGSMLVFGGLLFMLFREGMSGLVLIAGIAFIILFILTLITSPVTSLIILASALLVVYLLHRRSLPRYHRLRHRGKLLKLYLLALVIGAGYIFSVDFFFEKVLQEHQRDRIELLLGITEDPMGVGYNVNQSKIAIGSGGFFGKGYLQGTQTKYSFVPEQSTDFIFCTVGEEWGFVGSIFLIILYATLLIRILNLSEKAGNSFVRIYGYCVAFCFAMHVFINIGMTIGLLPVIGIPLPFMSYGGSSLLCFTIMLFIFIRLDLERWKYNN